MKLVINIKNINVNINEDESTSDFTELVKDLINPLISLLKPEEKKEEKELTWQEFLAFRINAAFKRHNKGIIYLTPSYITEFLNSYGYKVEKDEVVDYLKFNEVILSDEISFQPYDLDTHELHDEITGEPFIFEE